MAIESSSASGASPPTDISTKTDYHAFLETAIPEYRETLRDHGYAETARALIHDYELNAWEITQVDTQTGLSFDEMSTEPALDSHKKHASASKKRSATSRRQTTSDSTLTTPLVSTRPRGVR